MKYGVIGVGGVGLTFATFLRGAGHPVRLLCALPEQVESLRQGPVTIQGEAKASAVFPDIDLDLKSFLRHEYDFILVATKSTDSPELLRQIKTLGAPAGTLFVSCQNGLDVEEQIIQTIGPGRGLRMVINMGCKLNSPREVFASFCYTQYLSLRKDTDPGRVKQLAKELTDAGLPTEARADYQLHVFKKAILNASLGTVCALTGNTMRAAYEDPDLLHIVFEMVAEGVRVGQAVGLDLSDEFLAEAKKYFMGAGDHKPTLLIDIEEGRRTENDDMGGRICHYARENSVSIPFTQTIYQLMRSLENRRRKS